uniref:Uncharacterized protein n=1 Tax=Human herpesvirus 2 TaxID=10310 RepID=A0A481TU90_HHV2|nr:hypothetical protein [Human alphaherpesvirus 2]
MGSVSSSHSSSPGPPASGNQSPSPSSPPAEGPSPAQTGGARGRQALLKK